MFLTIKCLINQKFYLISNEKEIEIQQLDVHDFNSEWTLEKNKSEPPRNKLAIFKAGTTNSNGYSEFYICTYNELENFGVIYDSKFESVVNIKINKLNRECN